MELANIFSMARQLADEETNLPLIAQGEMGPHTTKTSSGMAMLMNSSNIVLRKAVKNWDDDITRPLITRFYDWNMQFSVKAEIKGDFSIEARGSGALLVREKQQENLMIYSNLSMQIREFAKRRKWSELDREIAKSLEVPYDQITLDEEEIEEQEAQAMEMMLQQQQQGDPAMQVAQANMQLKQLDLQIKQARLELDAQKAQAGIQLDQAELQANTQMQMEKMEQVERLELQKLRTQAQLKQMELDAKYQINSENLSIKTGIEAQKIRTDRDKAAANTNLRLTDSQLKSRNLDQGFDTFG